MKDNRFYTYAYLRKGDRTPYYIGKGTGKRAYDRHTHRVKVPDDRDRIIFLKENVSEREAWDYETEMIQFYGRKDLGTGILRNLSDGGEGPANPSPEARKKNSERNKKAYADGINPLSRLTLEERIEYGKIAAKSRAEGQWLKDNPEYNGGSLGRTPEQHSADSARAAQKGIVQWTKDKWENDPEWAAEQREKSRQTGLRNAELGIGIAGLTKEQRSANTKALYEGENGDYYRKLLSEKGKKQYAQGIGIADPEVRKKCVEINLERTGHDFTVRSPDGKIYTGHGIKPFARKHGIPMESFRSLVIGQTPKIMGWTLPDYDEYQVLNLCRQGKTREEIEKIVGYGIRHLSNHFPKPKEGHKYCYCCFEELPLSDFNKDKSRFDGLREKCRKCCMKPEEWNMRKLREKGLKTCLTCEKVLPFSEFNVGKSHCKCCHSIKNKKITEEKHKKIIEKNEHKDCVYCGKPFLITPTTRKDKIFCSQRCKDRDRNSRRVKKRPTFPPAKEGYKWCTRCKQELPFSEFWKDKDKKDGYATQCKCCKSR